MTKTLVVLFMAASSGLVLLPWTLTEARQHQCSKVTYVMDLRTCFTQRDMDREVTIVSQDSLFHTGLQAEGIMADPVRICSDKKTFTELFDCISGTTVKCATEDTEQSYLPNGTLTGQGLDYFCQHLADIDKGCYNDSYREVFECVNKLVQENVKSNDTAPTKACTTADITHDCIHANVLCDAGTRDLLLKFQDDYRKPPGCPPPGRHGRKKYIEMTTGGAAVQRLVSKVFCVALTFVLVIMASDV